jgi:hypothetical protein
MEIQSKLSRFQADVDPSTGQVSMQGFWQKVVEEGSEKVIGQMVQGFDTTYGSLADADAAALENPDFVAIAANFQNSPFTTFCLLLEALKEDQ